jgi:uncharacterized membrane-anchored protein
MRRTLNQGPSRGSLSHVLLKVPEITVYFWAVKLLSTAMGEATSDYFVLDVNRYLGVIFGFVVLVLALALQFAARRYNAWTYWFAVTMVAVFGTMAADVLHVVLGVSYAASTAFFAVCLAVVFVLWYRSERTLSIHTIVAGRKEMFYWATVICTFALGTAAGDFTASTLNLGYFASIVLFAVLFILPALGYFFLRLNSVAMFWFAYVMTRPLGASVADWLSKHVYGGLGLGDGSVALAFTVLIAILVGYLAVSKVDVPASHSAARPPEPGG